MSKEIMVYKLDNKKWAVALNPKTNCQLWHFATKKRALEKAKELEMSMSNTIIVRTQTCSVCGEYEMWSLDRAAVTRWREGENIQHAFPDMSAGDREVLISGTHPACWDKLFGEENEND